MICTGAHQSNERMFGVTFLQQITKELLPNYAISELQRNQFYPIKDRISLSYTRGQNASYKNDYQACPRAWICLME